MKKKLIALLLGVSLSAALVFTGCGSNTSEQNAKPTEAATIDVAKKDGINYMALVNKTHALPENWEKQLETVHMTNSVGDDVEVEKKAYAAYLKLKSDLEKENIYVDLDSARRSVAEQQRIMDDFINKYGAEYAAKTVAKPGYSEHHTGLALDLYLIIDGKDITENEDMVQYPEIWAKIHEKLAGCGFTLRYLEGSEHITGYGYEPWHIRYLDNKETAKEIMTKGITFEEYLGAASSDPVEIDHGKSNNFSQDDLKAAVVSIKCQFAFWDGCTLKSIRYAGDNAVTEEAVSQLKAKNPKLNASQVACFLMDFHTSDKTDSTTFEPNHDYKDYQWWLSKSDDGWEILDFGYSKL
ncbi:MAG: M15 family metallopeptidase [Ruminococcus sp.]|nr:M15 family metallopeptidase [Ruminococcus sp.]